jgi:hypothetical protein
MAVVERGEPEPVCRRLDRLIFEWAERLPPEVRDYLFSQLHEFPIS